jgi:ubiquinone/menaquinone biosynthesis C-methylase UbiE
MNYKQKIKDFYAHYDEQARLIGRHDLERTRTQEIISRFFGEAAEKIADIGGGAGIYAFWLAELGHIVDLIDLVPKHIDQARETEKKTGIKLNSKQQGDAVNLPFNDSSYDKVLLLGPLYHTQDRAERIKIIREALRILKPGGYLFAAAISRFASLTDGLKRDFLTDSAFRKILDRDLADGCHINETGLEKYFTTSFFQHPDDHYSELVEAGCSEVSVLPIEGIGSIITDVDEKLNNPQYREQVFTYIRKTEEEQSILGISLHLMGVGRKPEKA